MVEDIIEFEERKIRRIFSRLCFIREDLAEIEKIGIENGEIIKMIGEMRERSEKLFNILKNERK